MEVGSSHLVWFAIQLAINTQNVMHIFTCRPKLWWYAPVASPDNTIYDAWKISKDFECSVAAILKILNGDYHKDHVMYPHICYDVLHTWSPMHKLSCTYSHVDQSYNNLKFLVAAILKFLMAAITRIRWYVLTFCMMCYIAVHQYTKFHANIHM